MIVPEQGSDPSDSDDEMAVKLQYSEAAQHDALLGDAEDGSAEVQNDAVVSADAEH